MSRPLPAFVPLRAAGVAVIEPQDVVTLLNAATLASLGGRSVAIDGAQLLELVHVWLRVAAKHEEISLRPHLYTAATRELVELMLLGAPAVVEVAEVRAASRIVAEEAAANDGGPPPPPFMRCLCGADFLPEAHHCPMCGRFVE